MQLCFSLSALFFSESEFRYHSSLRLCIYYKSIFSIESIKISNELSNQTQYLYLQPDFLNEIRCLKNHSLYLKLILVLSRNINDNKKFWKTIKPFFSNKGLNTNKLMIIEKKNLVSEESVLANMMDQYFTNITKQLKLKKSPPLKNLEDIINYYHNHISIEKIRSSNNTQSKLFTFNLVSSDKSKQEILNLNNKKTSREGDIPVNILKDAIDTYLPILTKVINSSIEQNELPNELKRADFIPIYKKKDPLNKENYRPVSLLSHMSKVFERLLHKQVKTFMSNKLSNKLSGFRKNYNTQYCLTYMLEKWKNTLEKGKHVGAVFMDLSKAFDTINHALLIAKLKAYRFSNNTCYSCLVT